MLSEAMFPHVRGAHAPRVLATAPPLSRTFGKRGFLTVRKHFFGGGAEIYTRGACAPQTAR